MSRKEKNDLWITIIIISILDIHFFMIHSTYYRINLFKVQNTLMLLVLLPIVLYFELKDLYKKNKKNDEKNKDDEDEGK